MFKVIEEVRHRYPDFSWPEILTCLAGQANNRECGGVLLAPAPGTELGWVGSETGDWVAISNEPQEPFIVPLAALSQLGVDLVPAVDDRFWSYEVADTTLQHWTRWVPLYGIVHQLVSISTSFYRVTWPGAKYTRAMVGIRTFGPAGRVVPVGIRFLVDGWNVVYHDTPVWNSSDRAELEAGLRLWLCESNWTIEDNQPLLEPA